jgi:peptide/nickel transport system permease protein
MAVTAAGLGQAPQQTRARAQALTGIFRAIRSNRKATAGAIILLIFTVIALVPGLIAHDDPNADRYGRSLGMSAHHLFGTTAFGQDLFAQVIWGTRQTMIIAVVVGLLATVLSVIIGVSAAYLGGIWDDILSLVTDIFLVIPTFPLIIVIAAYARNGGSVVLISALVVTCWSYGARQLRAQTLSLRNREFLEAARVRGERRSYIIFVEVLPTMTSLMVANFLGAALYAVLTAAGLQFVGLGDVNKVSWGTMLYWAQNNSALQTSQYLWALAPGICIAVLGTAFALLNYAFDEIGNPALRPVRRIRVKHS